MPFTFHRGGFCTSRSSRASRCFMTGALLLASLGYRLPAQTATGEISITVMDASHALLPQAHVRIIGADTGALVRETDSNDQGVADIPLLLSGRYNVQVTVPGFRTLNRDGVSLLVGNTVDLQLTMELGENTQSVTVTGDAPLVEDKSETLSQVMQAKELQNLPLNGRSYLSAANLIPGAIPNIISRDGSFSAYGNNGLQNAFLLDGVRNINYLRGLDNGARDAVRPPLDAVQEFTVQTSNFSAEFGASAGAVVNAVTRSGTNKIHGSAYDFMQNSDLNAINYFASGPVRKPLLVQNQYGGSLGGPILRDHIFLFGAYEGQHSHTDSLSTSQVPTALQRTGDFSGGPTIYDPLTTQGTGTTATRTAYIGNKLPAGQINQALQALVNEYPLPNDPVDGPTYYKRLVPSLGDNKNGVVRGDIQFNARNSIFARYSRQQSRSSGEAALPPPVQNPGVTAIDSQGIGFGFTRVLSPTFINEARFGYTGISITQHGTNPRNEVVPGSLDQSVTTGMPNLNISNFAGIGAEAIGNSSLSKTSGVWVFSDNLAKTWKTHVTKFGGEAFLIRPSTFATGNGRSSFTFNGVFTQNPRSRATTGSALADFLLGDATGLTTGTVSVSEERGWYADGYIADQWTMSQALTVSYGIRYEFASPYIDTQNRMANFIYDSTNKLFGQYIFAGDARLPRALVYANHANVAPRLGLAYRVPEVQNMTVRSSFGIFYGQDQGNGAKYELVANPPFYGYGSQSISSDQLHPSSGFVINSSSSIARPTPIPPSEFTLVPSATAQLVSYSTTLRTPYVEQWSLSVQKELPYNTLVEVNYVGNHAVHLRSQGEANQPTVLNSTTVNSRRPLAQYTQASVRAISDWNFSNYNGLSAKFEKRLQHGISFLNSFTYGHNLDLQNPAEDLGSTGVASDTIQDNYNRSANYGNSDQDIRFRYALSGFLQLPFGPGQAYLQHGVASLLAGGWGVSPVYVYQTGSYFTPALSVDYANAGTLTRPNRVCNGNISGGTIKKWFDTSCFVAPPSYTFGNSGKNILQGPPNNQLNLTVQRQFAFERFHQSVLNLRLEGYNVLNHPQFNNPGATVGNTGYGVITSAGATRQVQIAARFVF